MKVIRRFEILIIAVALVTVCGLAVTCSDSYAASGPGKVSSLKISRYTPNQVKLSWGKATGASSYKVYRREAGGSYKRIKTVYDRSAVFKQTQGKRYYYKVRAYSQGRYGSYSSTRNYLLKKTDHLYYSNYRCMRIGENIYCTDYDSIYRYNPLTEQLDTMCTGQSYVDGVIYLDGFLYYESRGNGITNSNRIRRINLETGAVKTLVKDAGSSAFALKDNKIYYSKYKDYKYLGLRTRVYDIATGESRYDDEMLMYDKASKYYSSNDPTYYVETEYGPDYSSTIYLITPKGRVFLSDEIYP